MKIISLSALFTVLLAAAFVVGCQNAVSTNTASNQAANSNLSNAGSANANNPNAEKKPEAAKTEFSLATPTDAYKTAYALREKKDVEGMKKVMSADIIKFLTDVGKDEKKTLDDEIKSIFDNPQAKTAEVRNEKITDDTATLEYLDPDGGWSTMDFIKEGNEWKLTINKADKPPTDTPGKKK